MRHFTWHLVLLLEENPLVKIISNICAQDHNITSKETLSRRVTMERVSPVRVSIRFFVFHLYKQIQSDSLVPLKCNMLGFYHRYDYIVARARTVLFIWEARYSQRLQTPVCSKPYECNVKVGLLNPVFTTLERTCQERTFSSAVWFLVSATLMLGPVCLYRWRLPFVSPPFAFIRLVATETWPEGFMNCTGFNDSAGRRHENRCHKYRCNDTVPRILLYIYSYFRLV